jgi:hypothetical protein
MALSNVDPNTGMEYDFRDYSSISSPYSCNSCYSTQFHCATMPVNYTCYPIPPKKEELSKFLGRMVMYKNKTWKCIATANGRISLERKTFFLRRMKYDTASVYELRILI